MRRETPYNYWTKFRKAIEQAIKRDIIIKNPTEGIIVRRITGQLKKNCNPFALLSNETVEWIKGIFSNAVNLANSLEVSGIDPEFESICMEKHLEGHRVEDHSNRRLQYSAHTRGIIFD